MNDAHDWRHRRANTGNDPLPDNHGGPTGPVDWPRDGADGEPVDISQVAFDDQFIDALSRDVPVETRDDEEYQLAALLSDWRHGIVDQPAPELPTVDEVQRAIAATERASRGKRMVRHLRVISGAAAIVIVAAAGLTVLSEGSQPGDPLWPVKKVVFAQAASETQAAHDVRSNLEQAEAAMAIGDTSAAASYIAKAESQMGPMRKGDTRDQMNDWISRLRAGTAKSASPTGSPSTTGPGSVTTSPGDDSTTVDPRTRTGTDARTTPPESTNPRTDTTTPGTTPPTTPRGDTPTTTNPPGPGPSNPPGPGPTNPPEPTRQTPVPTTTTTTFTTAVPLPPPSSTLQSTPADVPDEPVPTVTTTTTTVVPSR